MHKLKSSMFFIGILSMVGFLPQITWANTATNETAGQYIEGSTITANIKTRLLADPDVKSLNISVTTEKGVVTLSGSVESQAQVDKAVSIAKEVKGVNSVDNQLKITSKTE